MLDCRSVLTVQCNSGRFGRYHDVLPARPGHSQGITRSEAAQTCLNHAPGITIDCDAALLSKDKRRPAARCADDEAGAPRERHVPQQVRGDADNRPNGSRLSCGALKKDSFRNLRAPSASSAC
jgi:hypothetical protein